MKDLLGREITYLRLSVTDLCNLKCKYCMPKEGIEKFKCEDILSIEEITSAVENLVNMGIKKVRITGGEPLVRKGIRVLFKNISEIKGLDEIAITTNGIFLTEYIDDLYKYNIGKINISIDTLNPNKFKDITRGGDLEKVIKGINAAIKYKMTLKLNVVHIGGFNDVEVNEFIELTKDKNIEVRFIELMKTGEAIKFSDEKFISNNKILAKNPQLIKTSTLRLSGPAQYYKLPGALGKVGFISPMSNKFCDKCNRIRLTAKGELITCLHSNTGKNIREYIGDKEKFKKVIENEILKKPNSHELEKNIFSNTYMTKIGG